VLSRSLSQVPDHVLVEELKQLLADGRANLVDVLLHLAEFDVRRLHLPAAYPSLFEYCVRELHLSEGEAFGRIRAARVARRFPLVLGMLADGRLHLTAVVLLAPYLRPDNSDELFEMATHRSKAEIQTRLAQRFPQPDVPTRLVPIAIASPSPAPESASQVVVDSESGQLMPASVEIIGVSASSAPPAPERFALHCTLHEQEMADLRRAQELLGRTIPSGDAARVIGRALRLLVEKLEKPLKGKSQASESAPAAPLATDTRHVPAETRRQVWQRDSSQCTFVSESGQRCDSRRDLELDHVVPFARGGRTSVDNLRLRCRSHNQYEADRTFGAGFMAEKRACTRARASESQDRSHVDELIPWLMSLKFRKDEARRGAELCLEMRGASLEDRIRVALQGLGRARHQRCTIPAPVASP